MLREAGSFRIVACGIEGPARHGEWPDAAWSGPWLALELEASVGEGADPVLGDTPPRVQAALDGAVVVERLVLYLDDQKREPRGVPSRWYRRASVTTAMSGSESSRASGRLVRTPELGAAEYLGEALGHQFDSDGVLASLGRPGAQVSVEQLELGVRLERAGFDRAFELGPAQTVVAADRDRNGGLSHRASMTRPCDRAGHSFSVPVNAPKSDRNRPRGGAGIDRTAGLVTLLPAAW